MEEDSTEIESLIEDAVLRRERLRTLALAERQQHRAAAFNQNRVALGSLRQVPLTAKFVEEKANALKKKALPIEEYRQLQDALIESNENINTFLKVNNILFALARDLSCKDPALQLCAANCCCNIALGNVKACNSLTKSIAPYLITDLDSQNYPLLEISIWTIGNLVAGSERSFEVFHAQNCLKYIISLMHDCDATILPSVSYTAMHYVRAGFNCITENEMMELARVTVERKFPYIDHNLAWLLALLSSVTACNTYVRNILPRIVECLHENTENDTCAVSKIAACIIMLANIISESSGEVACTLLKQLNLQMLLNKYISYDNIHIKKNTLWLIGNLANHDSSSVREITKDILPHLLCLDQAIEFCRHLCNHDGHNPNKHDAITF